jgi:hypothetical protein
MMTLVRKRSLPVATRRILVVGFALCLDVSGASAQTSSASVQQPGVDSSANVPDLTGQTGPHRRHPEAVKALDQLKSPY